MAGIQVEQLDLPSLARYFATKKTMSDGNTDLNNKIDKEISDLNKSVTNQVNSLKAKDTELNSKIDTEVSSRKSADTTLDNRITSEVRNLNTTINSKESSLNSRITAEENARAAKDTELNNAIIANVSNLNSTIQKSNVLSNGICYSSVITGDGTKTSFIVTHNLNTNKAQVTVLDSNNYIVYPSVQVGTNDVTISFFTAPTSGTNYTIVVTASDK